MSHDDTATMTGRLNEDCNHDNQCPDNAFCSTKKHGCLCQNGYGATILKNNGVETFECLQKTCSQSSDCESEYHVCDENKCKCLADHFDPHSATCYKFGSTGGQPDGGSISNQTSPNESISSPKDSDNFINSILNDLKNGDRLWPMVVGIIFLAILLLLFIIFLVRRYCLGSCWNAHKKEYEPNNKTRNTQEFNKNSINNKSFRQKKGEIDDEDRSVNEDDCTAADRSNLVTTAISKDKSKNKNQIGNSTSSPGSPFNSAAIGNANETHYVKVDMSKSYSNTDNNQRYPQTNGHHYQPFHQVLSKPLASSTSTPV